MTSPIAGGAACAPSCSSRIPIVPVRYAVLPGNPNAAAYAYATSGYALAQDLPALKEATYALRALRPGYIYVYMSGSAGSKLVIHEYDGEGRYRELTYTGLERYHRRDAYREGGRALWVWADTSPEWAKEVWIGYSTHLWTNAITAKVMGDKTWRQRLMQPLDVHDLTNGEKKPSTQKHVMPASALSTWVEDYKPKAQRIPLAWSSCSSKDELPLKTILAQAQHYPVTQPRVPAVVALYDAEGLTLELGLTVAARQHQALDLKNALVAPTAKSASPDLPACMRLDVEKVQSASVDFHRKNMVAQLIDQTLRGMYASSAPANQRDPDRLADRRLEWERASAKGKPVPSKDAIAYGVLTTDNLSPGGARLAKRIEAKAYKDFLAERDKADQQLQQLLQRLAAAVANPDAWLATAEAANLNKPHSLAAAYSSYDRDHKISAQGLEQSIALCMHNMGNCILSQDGKDPRFTRLQAWVDDPSSPIYIALAAYNGFKQAVEQTLNQLEQKNDVKGTLLGASAAVINQLGAKFEGVNGATDLMAETIGTVMMDRLRGKTRWDKSRNLRKNVLAAANEANMVDVMGLLGARYRVTDALPAAEAKFTKEVQALIDTGMANVVTKTTTVDVKGTRAVTVTETKTLTIRPTLGGMGKVSTVGGLNFGVVYFNYINLASTFKEVTTHYTDENATNFAAALFGMLGSLGGAVVSARAAYVAIIIARGGSLPGGGFGVAMQRVFGSTAFSRLGGYPAIAYGLWTDLKKSARLENAKNEDAAMYTKRAGYAMAAGSIAVLEGTLSFAGASASIPLVGWVAAVIILVGGAAIVGALWLYAQADAENHRPLERWVTRSIFGNRMGDDSSKYEPDHRPKAYKGLEEELQGWYEAYYSPVMLNADAAKQLGWDGVDSTWHGHWFEADSAEFTVLLPGYVMGQSLWDGELSVPPRPSERLPLAVYAKTAPSLRMTPHGLLMHYKQVTGGKNLQLRLTYHPNQGLSETAEVAANFVLAS